MFLDSACSCLRTIHWSQVFNGEWRCSWSSADRRCSDYIWDHSEWSTISLSTQVRLILETWRYWKCMYHRAGVLVLGTRTHSTRVLNFRYSYFTRTREFQSNSTRSCTRTRGQVLRYSYEYWHEYWYSMVHFQCEGENHHTCEIKVRLTI